jgi:penicillin amidase
VPSSQVATLAAVRRLGIVLSAVAGVLVVLLVVVTGLGFWQVRRGYPQYDGTVTLPGLSSQVDVLRNQYGIPTVYADTPEDLFRAQGYLHAQERFWEMDFRRLLAAGRLAEIAGESAVETDTFLRALGWRRIAEEEAGLLGEQALSYYEAYAAGVNAWLEQTPQGARGVQYALLGLQGVDREPEPWTVADSLSFIRVVAWDLRHNPDREAERAVLSSILPPERLAQLYPEFLDEQMGTILTEEDLRQSAVATGDPAAAVTSLPAAAATSLNAAARTLRSVPSASRAGGVGSNSWVVDDERTATGATLLANDPHLGPSIPALFTQMGLRCRTVSAECPYDVKGFSAAALPGVAIGHNGRIAWGWTTPYVDTADLFLEKVDGERYLTEDGWQALDTRTETIDVAGGEPVEITVRSTRNGPLITSQDVSSSFALPELEAVGELAPVPADSPERGDGYEVALRWVGSAPGRSGEALLALNVAGNWEEFLDAIEPLDALAQNIVYADASGNTGYYIFGAIPIRRGYDGSTVMPGWTGPHPWVGTIPFEEKPHVYNPERGYLATANEKTVPDSYPYLLSADDQFSYRGDRIRGFLGADNNVSVQDAADLQMDSWSWLAERLTPTLLDIELDGYYAEGQALLTDWDFGHESDSAAAAYFNAVWARLLSLTFHDELPEEYWPTGNRRWFVVVDSLLDTPRDPWWDDITTEDVVETRDAILEQALVEARDELTERQSKDPSRWEWGAMHELDLVEPAFGTSGIGPVEWLFNRGPYPVGGGGNIVLANSWEASSGSYALTNAPTFRMIVDFSELDSSRWVNQTGQSGHPGHPSYDDQVAAWQTNEAPLMAWTDAAVEAETEYQLTLVPGSAQPPESAQSDQP